MVAADGTVISDVKGATNVCALKSNCVRRGYIDFSLARSVTKEFHEKKKKANIIKNDVLINSTGDGTIGRVAVFNESFPAVVDGHITIVRLNEPDLAWYIGAFLLSETGQRQMYRYINGSSGQVEIYPQDISRIWVKPPKSPQHKKQVADAFREAVALHSSFYKKLQSALMSV
jgi:type I restriction enzyme M protein